MQRVVLDNGLGQRTERVEADVQRHPRGVEQLDKRGREVQACRGRGCGARDVAVHGLVPLPVSERLVDVRGERRLAVRLALELHGPTTAAERLDELHRPETLARMQAARRLRERLPATVAEALDEEHLDGPARRAPQAQSRRHDPRVVHHDEQIADDVGQVAEHQMLDVSRLAPVDEEPGRVARLDRSLGDELGREIVVEDGGVHPARRVASLAMDALALERAKQRIADAAAGRPAPGAIEAALERSRDQVEALAAAAAELEASIPAHVGHAVRDGLRTEVLPVARHIAEIRGLLNQAIRRLERLEGDLLAERHARVDDLALLVELVSSGWRGVDARLQRLETARPAGDPVEAELEELGRPAAAERELEHAAAA